MNFIKNSRLKITNHNISVDVEKDGVRFLKVIPNQFNMNILLNQIKDIKYKSFYKNVGGKWRRNNILEDKMSFIPMSYGFYFYLVNTNYIPSLDIFCNFFINSFCEKKNEFYCFKENYSTNSQYEFKYEDLAAKICRAYGSYLREITLLCRLFELQKKYNEYASYEIFYDIQEDIIGGSDIIIKTEIGTYGILITQKSKNSDFYNAKKRNHRHNYNYDQYIYVKLNEDETEDCGDIKIFTENVAKNILTQIDNFSKK